jgi:putative ABC transport system substrate-binding protein
VASLARPGGNLTGINFFNSELNAKRLQVLHELVPGARRIALLVNPNSAASASAVPELEAAAVALGLQVYVLNAGTSGEINAAFATFERERRHSRKLGASRR